MPTVGSRPERPRRLPGLLPSPSLMPTVHHPNPEVLSLVHTVPCWSKTDEDHSLSAISSYSSIFQYFWLKATVIKRWYFCVVLAPDQISGLLTPHPPRLWVRGVVLNVPRSCWSPFICLVPVCRTRRWKISEILPERLQGHTLAGVSYICMEPSQKWAFGAQTRDHNRWIVKISFIFWKKNQYLHRFITSIKYILQFFSALCGCSFIGTDVSFFFSMYRR